MVLKNQKPDKELQLRVKTIMVLRVVFLTGFVGVIVGFEQRVGLPGPIIPLSVVLAAGYSLCLLYALLFRWLQNYLGLHASVQVVGDLFLVCGLLYATGGIDSPLSFLYIFVIIATSVMLPRTACYLAASGASILYGLLVDFEYFNFIQPVELFTVATHVTFEGGYGFYIIIINVASYYAVAYLSGILSNRLLVIKEELAMTSIDLQELQAFNQSVIQNMGNGLITTDLQGRITSVNRAGQETTGYALSETLNRPCYEILDLPEFEKLFRPPLPPAMPVQISGPCTRKGEQSIFIRAKLSRLGEPGEPAKGYICVFEDLTEMKDMQEKIGQAEQLAAIGRISAGLAHEIRNPLASLSGSIQMLRNELHLDSVYQKLMDIVVRETDRLNSIVSDFLNYSQPRRHRMGLVDLTGIIQDAITLMKNSEDCPPGVDIVFQAGPGHLTLQSDEEEVRQLVWNLCRNGLQAMDDGGSLLVQLTAVETFRSVNYASTEPGVVLTVADNGCGIPPDQIKTIFDPFYTTKENGVGLGLATVYQIVQRNGGHIDVKSQVGQGTTFTLFLPFSGAEPETDPRPAPSVAGPTPSPGSRTA